MEITRKHVAAVIANYLQTFVRSNSSATILRDRLVSAGVGLRPLVDHISFRTKQVHERALEFEALGFSFDDTIGVVERDEYWYKVYRKPGFPAVLIHQAHEDARGAKSPIPDWVDRFTDGEVHHVAVVVDRLEDTIMSLEGSGISFCGQIIGDTDSEFRQIYAEPEMVDGHPFSVLEFIERHWGFTGFLSLNSPEYSMTRRGNV